MIGEFLIRNSKPHLIQKFAAGIGAALFLQISADFIVSVGLTENIHLVELPQGIGSQFARSEAKEDILAISRIFSDFEILIELPFRHLFGVSLAFVTSVSLFIFSRIAEKIGD